MNYYVKYALVETNQQGAGEFLLTEAGQAAEFGSREGAANVIDALIEAFSKHSGGGYFAELVELFGGEPEISSFWILEATEIEGSRKYVARPVLYLETLDEHQSALYSIGTDLKSATRAALEIYAKEKRPVFLRVETNKSGTWEEARAEIVNAAGALQPDALSIATKTN